MESIEERAEAEIQMMNDIYSKMLQEQQRELRGTTPIEEDPEQIFALPDDWACGDDNFGLRKCI